MAVLVVMLFAVLVRTARIQIAEHDIWAKEAVNLERRSSLVPYHRGDIMASDGLTLVEDIKRYEIGFQWREFRRENTIGQVALASAAWDGEPVSLIRDPEELGERAVSLLKLSPADLSRLASSSGKGEPEDATVKRRRAADAAFYMRRILALESRSEGRLRQLMSLKEETRSVLELAAVASGLEDLEGAVRERCWESLDDIARLELLLKKGPRGSLLGELEERGEAVADAVASRLFQSAFGFSAGRLRTTSLARLDLGWLRRTLGWSVEREAQWRARARENWREWVLSLEAPEAALRARLSEESSLGDLLVFLSFVFSSEGASDFPWLGSPRDRGDSELFQLDDSPELVEPAPAFISVQEGIADKGAALLDGLQGVSLSELELGDWHGEWSSESLKGWSAPLDIEEASELWRAGRSSDQLHLSQWLATRWALEWERDWSRLLESLDKGAGVRLSPERIKSALDDYAHFLKDLGRRVHPFEGSPDYDAVFLLTRYPERFRGFEVETRTRRTKNEAELPLADPLWNILGHARTMTLEDSLTQESDRVEFGALRVALRTERNDASLRRLVQTLTRQDEQHGADGIERLMDEELSGENGYKEHEGLAERSVRKGSTANMRPVHGEDVQLTLDLSLQRAASEVINRPDPTGDPIKDEAWFKTPTGAICLITPEGEVLAAASAPNVEGRVAIPSRDGQGAYPYERTLRRYTGLPVGSVFKPFTALWCLEEGLVTAEHSLSCVLRARDGRMVAGYHSVNCHRSIGHGELVMADALRVSCNAYFAQLGGRIGSLEGLAGCARTFGFDLPTGVNDGFAGRGIREDYLNPSFHKKSSFSLSDLERGANGLSVIEGTPLQVARAFASIATGALPSLSFVQAEEPAPAVPLPISARHLSTVREALIDVAQNGSAKLLKDLDVAVKTGSADYLPMSDEIAMQLHYPAGKRPDSRKHTWVAGWSPAEDPRLIFVVYLHDVGVTSSHSAVFIARQLLERAEVQSYLGADQ
jgi:cell division protein FtsI/penicillin-binding protein 2